MHATKVGLGANNDDVIGHQRWSSLCPYLISSSHRFLFRPAPPIPFPLSSALQSCSPLPAPTPSSCPRSAVGWYLSRRAGAGRVEQRAKAWLGFWNLSLSSHRGAAVAGPQSLRIFRFYLPADTKASPGVRGRRARTHGCAHTRTTAQRRAHLCIHTERHTDTFRAGSRAQPCTHSHWLALACTRSRGPAAVGSLAFTLWARTRRAAHRATHARSHPHTPRPWRRSGRCAAPATGGDPGGGGGGGDSGGGGAGSRERAGPRSSWRPGIFQPGS